MSLLTIFQAMEGGGGVPPPVGDSAPLETAYGFSLSGFPVYLRAIDNRSELGVAENTGELVTLLNNTEWDAYGTWSYSGGQYRCTGTPPARIIGYNQTGVIFESTDVADWSVHEGAGLFTYVNDAGKIKLYSTDTGSYHSIKLDAYGDTLLNAVKMSFDIEILSGNLNFGIGIDAARQFMALRGTLNSHSWSGGTITSGGVGSGVGTYSVELTINGNAISLTLRQGLLVDTIEGEVPPSFTEHNCGKWFLRFVEVDALISNFKIAVTAYKNIDHIGVGDSLLWGRDATDWSSTWFNQLINGKPNAFYAHGDTGFDFWLSSSNELDALQPANVWVMGSYVDTPSGLATFQTKYQDFIDILKANPDLIHINHFASCPNNFGTDIRPFNDWKASTFNAGVDRYIPESFSSLLESGTDYNLEPTYESFGSHLNQTGQDTLVAALASYAP